MTPPAGASEGPAGGARPRLSPEVVRALGAVLLARTAVNGSQRVVYPFLPEIARGLGTSLAVLGALVAARSLIGLLAPVAARGAEVAGRRWLMLGGVAAAGIGTLVLGLAPGLAVAAAAFVVVGLAKPAFDVPMQGWFGARVPYAQRGRVLGITELTWAGGLLATVPLAGWLISATSWRALAVPVVVLAAGGAVAVWRLLPADRPRHPQPRPLRLTRQRLLVLAATFAFALAGESMFVVYGAWLEADLGLTVAAIGVFTVVVVAGELTGEGLVAAVGDRLGLRRAVLAGLAMSAVAYLCLGLVGASVVGAIVVVLAWFVGYEVTIVATVPLISEMGGQARDRLLGLMMVMIASARGVGALLGPALFAAGGITAAGVLAACAAVTSAALMAAVRSPSVSPAAPAAGPPPPPGLPRS